MKDVVLWTTSFYFMKTRSLHALQFAFRCYLIAVVINSVVSATDILHEKDYTFSYFMQVVFVTTSLSFLFFAIICTFIYLICRIGGMGREGIFWLLMSISIVASFFLYFEYKAVFHSYTNQPTYIAAIAAFSIMVSLSSQYQFFYGVESQSIIEGLTEN